MFVVQYLIVELEITLLNILHGLSRVLSCYCCGRVVQNRVTESLRWLIPCLRRVYLVNVVSRVVYIAF